MKAELQQELIAALRRVDRFLERVSEMLAWANQGLELPKELLLNEAELQSLDKSLQLLVAKLTRSSQVSEEIWCPPVRYAYRYGYGKKDRWAWLECFGTALRNTREYIDSFQGAGEVGEVSTYNVHIEQGAGFAIGPHARGRAERVHQVNKNIDITLLADELTLLREAMKKESSTADQDTAVGAIAAAEIAARAGNTKKMRSHLKSAGKWAFDVATKIGISVAAKALEPYIK